MLDVKYHLNKLTNVKEKVRINHARELWWAAMRQENHDALLPYIPVFKRNLHNQCRLVGVFCVGILYELGEPPNLYTLMLALEEDDPSTQIFAMRLIGEWIGAEAKPLIPLLYQRLLDKSGAVKDHAYRALAALDVPDIHRGNFQFAEYMMNYHGYLTWDDITVIID